MSISSFPYEFPSQVPVSPILQQFSDSERRIPYLGTQNFLVKDRNFIQERAKVFFTDPKKCITGFLGGTAGSLITKNPLPLLLGLSECFPKVFAQQEVGPEFQINTYIADDQTEPSVASFENGNFVVTWGSRDQDGSSDGVYGQLFDENGSKIGNEFQINTHVDNQQAGPSVATFSNDNFVTTWSSYLQDGSNGGVYGQLFHGNGSKIGNEFLVNTNTFDRQWTPSVTTFSNGNFVVTWESFLQDGYDDGVFGQVFSGNGTKIGSEFQVNTYVQSVQENSAVASLANGNFVVTWESYLQDGSAQGVYGQLFDGNRSKIGSEFQINTYTDLAQTRSSVASFKNGNFVVTWDSRQAGFWFGIYGQLFNGAGSPIGNEFLLSVWSLNSKSSVASFDNGNFVVTWDSQGKDGSPNSIFGQMFDQSGSKIGTEFKANTFGGIQARSSIATLKNNDFVVTWQSRYQDTNTSWGIYGQIFHDNITLTSSTSSITTTSITSTTSTTTTTSSITSDTSSSTSSSTSQTSTSLNPSFSSTPVPSTSRPLTTVGISRRIIPTPSNQNNRLLWIILGAAAGGATCVSLLGYYFFKNRFLKKDRDQPNDVRFTELPDVSAGTGEDENRYSKTPDFVSAIDGDYSRTPDFVTAVPYGKTPDFVTAQQE